MKLKFVSKISWMVPALCMVVFSCKDSFLSQPAAGALGTSQLLSQAGIEQMLIGAYAGLKGNNSWMAQPTNWVYGDVVGQESFKGSNSGDQSDINPLSTFTAPATNSYTTAKWQAVYDGVNRCNSVLKTLPLVAKGVISDADVTRITAEARFLRGFFHLEGYKVFKNIPYIDESIDYTKNNYNVPNTSDIMPNIIADFDYAYNNLPETQIAVGRANKWAAAAFKAKCYMFQKDFTNALALLTSIVASGKTAAGTKYALVPSFHELYNAANDNNAESVFTIQASVNDGSGAASANPDLVLNFPYGGNSVITCCGFDQPSFDLANSYRVNANGLPLLDGSFRSSPLSDEQWMTGASSITPDAGLLDPRIDWTVGRTGVPFLDWGMYTGPAWVRSLTDAGPYSPKKYDPLSSQVGTLTDGSSWTPGYDAINQYLMRYADVLLLAAEAEVEAGSLSNAMGYVNMVRARAQDPNTWVKISKQAGKSDYAAYLDPTITSVPAGNYKIGLYTVGDGTFSAKTTARNAVHFERRLELAMEGHRFFDYVRWGETTNANSNGNPVNLESSFKYNTNLAGKAIFGSGFQFKVGVSEIFLIPQTQIDLSNGVLKQNGGG